MIELRYTLVTDGTSDDALIPMLSWLLREQGVSSAIVPSWADLSRLPRKPKGLTEKVAHSLDLYPCDLVFVHRDAENQPAGRRREEIEYAMASILAPEVPPAICVIPVRMTEAWLLFDEGAIRKASGNPNGKVPLALPRMSRVEHEPDPKEVLTRMLREASELRGRHLRKLSTIGQARLVAKYLDNFKPLRQLSAFQSLEADLSHLVKERGWDRPDLAE